MKLSIIIPVCNDHQELIATINSIRATAGDKPEIIVVDDCSANPVTFLAKPEDLRGAKVITNKFRCGVGPSRHIGAMHACGDWLLLCDSHMRFKTGWHDLAIIRMQNREDTLYCGVMLGLDYKNLDVDHPKQVYHGATLNILGQDRQHKTGKMQVMEAVWNEKELEDDQPMFCPMGASYFVNREWFLRLRPLEHLRGWGMDEVMLGLKYWMAGGEVRLLKPVRIGHIYREQKDKKFTVPLGMPTYNKLFAIHTLLPNKLANHLEKMLKDSTQSGEWTEAFRMMRENWGVFEAERMRNEALFTESFESICEGFGLRLPV